jgi:hypothetical protein
LYVEQLNETGRLTAPGFAGGDVTLRVPLGGYAFDTGWSSAVHGATARETGDPLGIRVWANQIAAGLAPCLTNSTGNIQGYGLVCAGLELWETSAHSSQSRLRPLGPVEAWLRLERLWVIAQTAHAAASPGKGIPSWRGSLQARRSIGLDSVDLAVPLLGHQLSTGSWGAYRRSAGLLGLIAPRRSGRATNPADSRLTGHGRITAKAWRDRNLKPGRTAQQVAKILASGQTTAQEARSSFRADTAPYGKLPKALNGALESPDRADTRSRLAGLRAVWAKEPTLTAKSLKRHRRLLTAAQQDLAVQAAVVVDLFELVERPYRRWLCDTGAAGPDDGIWDNAAWAVAEAQSIEARELRAHGRATPGSWEGTSAWAARLAARRGSEATTPGEAPKGYDQAVAPAMALKSAAALFAQGLLGEPRSAAEVSGLVSKAEESADE